MFTCVRCGLPLYEADENVRQLILCCVFAERICPSCLADFMSESQPQVLSICQRCGRKIKLSDLHRKYTLYTNNLDRMMVSSRVSVNDFDSPFPNMKRSSSFSMNGFDGFGMQNCQNGYGNQGYGQNQQPMGNRQYNNDFARNQQTRQSQFMPNQQNPNALLQNVSKAKVVNVRPDQLGYLGKIYYNQGLIKPIGANMNNLSLGEDEYVEEMEVQQRQPRFGSQSFKKVCHFQQNLSNSSKKFYQPTFGQNDFFSNEATNRRVDLERHQRSLSANNRMMAQTNHQRPLSSNSRVPKQDQRPDKSPPSFGKNQI